MIAPLKLISIVDDVQGDHEDLFPVEKMKSRCDGPMPSGRHRNTRVGSRRTKKYRASQHRIAMALGGITQRRQKKVLAMPAAASLA